MGSGSGRCVSQSRVLGDAEDPVRGAWAVFPRVSQLLAEWGVEGQTMRLNKDLQIDGVS